MEEKEEDEEKRKYEEGKRIYIYIPTPTRARGKGWPREVASAGSLGGARSFFRGKTAIVGVSRLTNRFCSRPGQTSAHK